MPARRSMTPSCPSSLGLSLKMVSQAPSEPAERKKGGKCGLVFFFNFSLKEKADRERLLDFI